MSIVPLGNLLGAVREMLHCEFPIHMCMHTCIQIDTLAHTLVGEHVHTYPQTHIHTHVPGIFLQGPFEMAISMFPKC